MPSPPASISRLLVVQGDASLREIPVEGAVIVGRGEGCDLLLLDGAASRQHARFEPSGRAIRVVDLESTNGTWVNGKRIREAQLLDGDEVAIGGIRLRVRGAIPGETLVVGGISPPSRSAKGTPAVPSPLGRSAAFVAARGLADRAAASDLPVLLRGETGTGKEVFAHSIHARSRRNAGPFVVLHAAAISPGLFESELFGAEKGAFTGADARRDGFLARSHGGTLFLDEVGELAIDAQVKLLRVLETGEFHPVGSPVPRRSDFRLIAATNRDLERAVQTGAFRSDLLFRLNAVEIRLPPLRERLDDLPLFVDAWLGLGAKSASPDLVAALRSRPWPGNLRELRHVLDRAALVAKGPVVELGDLPPLAPPLAAVAAADATVSTAHPPEAAPAAAAPPEPPVSLDDAEKEAVIRALEATGGKRGAAARRLGISEPTLRRKLRRYGLDR